MKLRKRGKVTIAIGVAILLWGMVQILNSLPNYDTYEVRTMRVVERHPHNTILEDGNGECYSWGEKIYCKWVYVTIDNKGTNDPRDDRIISWVEKRN